MILLQEDKTYAGAVFCEEHAFFSSGRLPLNRLEFDRLLKIRKMFDNASENVQISFRKFTTVNSKYYKTHTAMMIEKPIQKVVRCYCA